MIDIKVQKGAVRVEVNGSVMEIATDVSVAIYNIQKQMRKDDENIANMFLDLLKTFINDFKFDITPHENLELKRNKLKDDIQTLSEVMDLDLDEIFDKLKVKKEKTRITKVDLYNEGG